MVEHYYSEEPETEFKLFKLKVENVRGMDFEYYTAPSVFSYRKLSRGALVLIENMIIEDGWDVLDLGCGYGPIGIAAAKLAENGYVVLTDINKRACDLAAMNLGLNEIENAGVRQGNLYEPVENEEFNTILNSPPLSAGKEICKKMIKRSKEHLKEDGIYQMVARHNKGGKSLSKYLKKVYGNLETIAKEGGFRVYIGEK